MFSTFGVASMLGTLFVKLGQDSLGFHGMLLVCIGFTASAAIITFFYDFHKFSYAEMADKLGI